MALVRCFTSYYPVSLLLLFLVVLVQPQGTTDSLPSSTTARWTPSITKDSPVSPVTYDFAGQESKICPVLISGTTAVVEAVVGDANQLFSVDLPMEVPITLLQKPGDCVGGSMESCVVSLFISTNMPDELSEGNFTAFLAGNQNVTISYGRLGLSLPSGRSTAIIFDEDHRTLSLYYRTMIRGETFRACNRDGDLLAGNFSVSMPSRLRECRLGREGGFSVPFRITVTYLGSEPFVGLVIVTSSSCADPYSTNSFIELDVQLPVEPSSTIPVSPMDTPPPTTPSTFVTLASSQLPPVTLTSSIITTPTTQPPTTSTSSGNSVPALVGGLFGGLVFVVLLIAVPVCVGCVLWLRRKQIHEKVVRQRSSNDGREDNTSLMDMSSSLLAHPPNEGTNSNSQSSGDIHHHIEVPASDDDNGTSISNPPLTSPGLFVVANGNVYPPPPPPSKSHTLDVVGPTGATAAQDVATVKLSEDQQTVPDCELPPPSGNGLSATPAQVVNNQEGRQEDKGSDETDESKGQPPLVSELKCEFYDSVESKVPLLQTNSMDKEGVNSNNMIAALNLSGDKNLSGISNRDGKEKFAKDDDKDKDTVRPERISGGGSLPASTKGLENIGIFLAEFKEMGRDIKDIKVMMKDNNTVLKATSANVVEVKRNQEEQRDDTLRHQLDEIQDLGGEENHPENAGNGPCDSYNYEHQLSNSSHPRKREPFHKDYKEFPDQDKSHQFED